MVLVSDTIRVLLVVLGMCGLICGAIAEHATLEIFNGDTPKQFEAWPRVLATITQRWPALVACGAERLLDAA